MEFRLSWLRIGDVSTEHDLTNGSYKEIVFLIHQIKCPDTQVSWYPAISRGIKNDAFQDMTP